MLRTAKMLSEQRVSPRETPSLLTVYPPVYLEGSSVLDWAGS